MPKRLEPFTNNSIYHVFNRTIDRRNIFKNKSECILFLSITEYYRSNKAKISFSKYKRLPLKIQSLISEKISIQKYHRVELLSYCLMPTHFHLLLRQKTDNGVPKFISDVINSFTRTFNLKSGRKGPIFLPKFKSVSLVTDEQLIHTSRYIHLNPYSNGTTDNISGILNYPWSSIDEYLNGAKLCNTDTILAYFHGNETKYKKFVLDNSDYQRYLQGFKYIEKW